MGHVSHDALIVTVFGYAFERGSEIHSAAAEIFGSLVTPLVKASVNDCYTFFVASCGSKSGWSEKEEHVAGLGRMIERLKKERYADGSSPFCWSLVSYGPDDAEATVDDHEWLDPLPVETE